jgi:hypothetical protein
VVENSHRPLVTAAEWEAANAVKGRAPVHTGLGEKAQLKGIVRCGSCGSVMHVLAYGKARDRRTYACTGSGGGCASMSLAKVEPAVLHMLDLAIAEGEPHVAAVIEGDSRYSDALSAVESARAALSEYRDSVEIQRELGLAGFAEGLRVRREAVEEARRALRETPRPEALSDRPMTLTEADLDSRRRFYQRAIAEVLVHPRGSQRRITLRWAGSDEPLAVPECRPAEGPAPELTEDAASTIVDAAGDGDSRRQGWRGSERRQRATTASSRGARGRAATG